MLSQTTVVLKALHARLLMGGWASPGSRVRRWSTQKPPCIMSRRGSLRWVEASEILICSMSDEQNKNQRREERGENSGESLLEDVRL